MALAHRRESDFRLAFGPEMPGWGSWDWVGADLEKALGSTLRISTFGPWEVPEGDAILIVKHVPPLEWVDRVSSQSVLLYCPVDYYGSPDEIACDACPPSRNACRNLS
jgi:hypothetical protein